MALKIDKNLEKNWFPLLKMTNFHQRTWKPQNWDFHGILLSKAEMYERKIYRGVIFHDNKVWCKNWRETDLSSQNWHDEFDEISPEHSKI